MPLAGSGSQSRHEFCSVLSHDLDCSWTDPVESEELSFTGSLEVADRAIPDGL